MKKVLIVVFLCFVCVTIYGCGINNTSSKNVSKDMLGKSNEKVEGTESTDDEGVSDIQESFTDIQKKYIEYMKENEYSNPKDETGELSCPYSFYDINKDGIDELIVLGGYINMQIYSIVDGKIEIIACNKYGGDFKIYPDKAVFSWSGGHKDHYYEEYTKIDSLNSSIVAEKKWEVDPRKGKKKKVEYYLNGKEGTKDKYNKKIKNINSGKSISIKELTWYNTEGQEELFS